jgi:pimeloyl-ACP methyl ester carboxylesterase
VTARKPKSLQTEQTTPPAAASTADFGDYFTDAAQRTVLFLDTLLNRGNSYIENLEKGTPSLLKFNSEMVLDGRELAQPCNYALLHLLPPESMPVNPTLRPVVVVDPRAGHGPGIGGFKFDSEVGVAMHAGHAVYFIAFRPQPEEGQTLFTVMHAEGRFMEEVIKRHPDCKARPVVIGNCQAGWAMMALNATRPDLFGPLMIVGAPLSYWAGSSTLNPMRYSGAALGGSWLASMTADMGADRFDGAHLVENFEKLNPANTLWSRYYKLWSNIDTEAERFLEFEKWWGGFFRMTGSEIEAIVENLFVGNRLARGTVMDGDKAIDLRAITAPVVVFASHGDNITPVPQALDWIIDTWGDERAIAAAGRTIIYVLHESVGHLGIFVGGDIARKEHDQLVTSLDMIESLPPGLYEMKLEAKAGMESLRWEQLEPGDYTVHYEHRTMKDILALNPEGREEEALFSTISKVSELNATFYKTWVRPWVKMMATRPIADAMTKMHPLRMQRQMFSDAFPFASIIRDQAAKARTNRVTVSDEHPLRKIEKKLDAQITESLNKYRDDRDAAAVKLARTLYGPKGLGAYFKPDAPDSEVAHARALKEIEVARQAVLGHLTEGGFAEAVCRIVLAGMVSIGSFERRSFRLAKLLAKLPADTIGKAASHTDWQTLLKSQARITAVAPVEALNALEQLLPTAVSRERALAVSAAVMMIEPTLANPRSEIIEFLIGTLRVDPERVIGLARDLTESFEETPESAASTSKPAKKAALKATAKKTVALAPAKRLQRTKQVA